MSARLTEVQVQVAATLGYVDAYIKGLRGVFKLLAAQHREAACLLASVTNARSGEEQQRLWGEARHRLLAHERAELGTVYSLLKSFPTTEQLAQRHAAGANEVEARVQELDALAPSDPTHGAKLSQLVALLNQHAKEEELEYFVRAQAHIGQRRAEALVGPFERAYRQQLEQLQLEHLLDVDQAPLSAAEASRSLVTR